MSNLIRIGKPLKKSRKVLLFIIIYFQVQEVLTQAKFFLISYDVFIPIPKFVEQIKMINHFWNNKLFNY